MSIIRTIPVLAATVASAWILSGDVTLAAQGRTTIQQGITINGTDVSGKSLSEVEAIIDDMAQVGRDTSFTLSCGSKKITATGDDLGLKPDPGLVQRVLNFGEDGNLLYRYKASRQLETGEGKDFKLNYQAEDSAIKEYLNANEAEVVSAAVDGTLKRENGSFVYVPGQEGHKLIIDQSAVVIEDYIINEWQGGAGNVKLVSDIDEPRGSEEELGAIEDVLGSYKTDFSSSTAARSQNVRNGASKIDGTVLYPGDEFSVAEALNPMTAENGYAMAPSYENGQTVETYGGGICQVSTTLYNAVIRAELEVTKRFAHSMIVHYVEPSMDAAIAGTSKDFQFRNNQEYPVYLEGYTDGGIIYFNVYGKETRASDREVSFESEVLSQTDPKTIYTASGSEGIGSINRTSGQAHTGYTARLWKIVTEGGKEISRDVFNNSTYRSTDNVYSVGTASSDPEASAIVSAAIGSQDLPTIQSAIGQAQNLIAQKQAQAEADAAAEAAAKAAAEAKNNEKAADKKPKKKAAEEEPEEPDDDLDEW